MLLNVKSVIRCVRNWPKDVWSLISRDAKLTSLLVTGFCNRTKCVRFRNPANGSRSASSEIWFSVKTSVVRWGIDFETAGWMTEMRLRASRRVRRRGLSGKLDSCEMSLSVKSMASWSYSPRRTRGERQHYNRSPI